MAEICTPLPGAVSLLNAIRGNAKIGIITNGFSALQQVRLERTGLRDYFDLLVISERSWRCQNRIRKFSIMRWNRRAILTVHAC